MKKKEAIKNLISFRVIEKSKGKDPKVRFTDEFSKALEGSISIIQKSKLDEKNENDMMGDMAFIALTNYLKPLVFTEEELIDYAEIICILIKNIGFYDDLKKFFKSRDLNG